MAASGWSEWPARGDQASSPEALELASRAWDQGAVGDRPVDHSDVRVLYLGHAPVVGYGRRSNDQNLWMALGEVT